MGKCAAPLVVLGGLAALMVGVIRWPWFGAALGIWFVLMCAAIVWLTYAAGELTDQAESLEEEAEYWRQWSAKRREK